MAHCTLFNGSLYPLESGFGPKIILRPFKKMPAFLSRPFDFDSKVLCRPLVVRELEIHFKMELIVKSDQPMHAMDLESPEQPASPASRMEAFTELMREHHRELLIYARAIVHDHHAAQDIVQDALVTSYKKFDQFDPSRNFAKWLRGIIRYKSLDWFRSQKRVPLPDTTLVEIELHLVPWQEPQKSGEASLSDAMIDCIARLPEGLKDAVIEYYLQENNSSETAAKLEISTSLVRKRLQRARANLHACLTEKIEEESASK